MAGHTNDEAQDERYQIADEAICDAFLLVLQGKDLEKVTVTDVIKRAGIVRSTFYNHYENIPALVSAVEDKTIQDIFSLMESFHPRSDREICRSFFLSICKYTMTNPFLAGILRSPRGDGFLEKALTMFHRYVSDLTQSMSFGPDSGEEFSYMIACVIGSTLGVLHKWTLENFRASPEMVADLLTKTFMAILPFLSQ